MSEAWRYELAPPATRDLRQLDAVGRQRIFAALDRLIANNGRGDVVKLAGVEDEYWLRIGDWRVRFSVRTVIEQEALPGTGEVRVHIIDVLRVLPRGRAYRN